MIARLRRCVLAGDRRIGSGHANCASDPCTRRLSLVPRPRSRRRKVRTGLHVRGRRIRTRGPSSAGFMQRAGLLATDAAAASTAVVKPQSRLMLIGGPASDTDYEPKHTWQPAPRKRTRARVDAHTAKPIVRRRFAGGSRIRTLSVPASSGEPHQRATDCLVIKGAAD